MYSGPVACTVLSYQLYPKLVSQIGTSTYTSSRDNKVYIMPCLHTTCSSRVHVTNQRAFMNAQNGNWPRHEPDSRLLRFCLSDRNRVGHHPAERMGHHPAALRPPTCNN